MPKPTESNEYTTVSMKFSTKRAAEKAGHKGETWDDLLMRLVKIHNLCVKLHGPMDMVEGIEAFGKKLLGQKSKSRGGA
ncbi:hypothetical protein ES703_48025 [subsurface metagenome]